MLLAIDTATVYSSIALHDGSVLRGECTWASADRHTATLLPRVTEMLDGAAVQMDGLTVLAVCVGPGSYTGVRIGVAAAKGLAAALHLPLVGISTLDILVAAQPRDDRPLYAVFSAGRKRLGYARYRCGNDGWVAESAVILASWDEFTAQIEPPAIVVGELGAARAGFDSSVEIPQSAWHLRRAGYLADLAWARLRSAGHGDPQFDPARVMPLYVQ